MCSIVWKTVLPRARACKFTLLGCCAEEQLEAVDNADDPKTALTDLIVGLEPAPEAAAGSDSLHEELSKLKHSELKKPQTKAAGAPEEQLEAVDDADDPKKALTDPIVGLEPAPGDRASLLEELSKLMNSELKMVS